MQKWEALKQLDTHENKPLGFCPLIKAECRIDCISYFPAIVSGTDSMAYITYEHCLSPLVTGYVETS